MKRFKFEKNLFSAIELGDSSIKIAQTELILGRPKLTHLFFAEINDLSKKETQDKIKSLLAKERIKINTCLLSLPRHKVSTRYLKLPSTDVEEIEKMVKLQIPKLLPYAPAEIVTSYKKIAFDSQGYTYCILILAQENLVRRYYSQLEALGIQPSTVILSSEGCAHWLKFIKKENIKNETVMVVDVDRTCADIMIINRGELIFTRSISRQVNVTSQDLSWQNLVRDEIRRCLNSANKELGPQDIKRLILSGSISSIENMDKILSENFSHPVEIVTEVNKEFIKGGVSIEEILKERDVSFTSVIGAAVSREDFSINLLPADIKSKLNWQKLKQQRFKCISLILLILLFSFGLFVKHIYDKHSLLKILEQRIETLLPQASMRENISSRLEIIRNQLKSDVFITQLLKEIYTIVGNDIFLNNLSIERNKFLILKGQANNLSGVFNLVNALEKNRYFENVRVRYATKRKIKTTEITDFQIECPLKMRK